MAKTFERRRAGLRCGFGAGGEREQETLTEAVAQARRRPGVDPAHSPTLARYGREAIGEGWAGRGGR